MKKIVLSSLVALTLGTVSATASDMKFYTDANGQLFITPGEGRTLLQANPKEVMEAMQQASSQISKKQIKEEIKAELKEEIKKETPVFAKADKLKFSGTAYLGYTYTSQEDNTLKDESQFEIRRAYLQLKAYLLDDPKSYYRVTLDAHNDGGSQDMRMKYAYLYLNNVLPSTGVELGLVHRPWHDYEEHNAWYFRNIQKVFTENTNGAHLSNSADFGFNFKTKTKFIDTEIGLFNGEGYHEDQVDANGISLEWRATAHILGVNGKDKQTKKTYWDASFFGQLNENHKASASGVVGAYDDLHFYGLHTVYNQPLFLVSAQYIYSEDTASNATYVSAQAGDGYSVNGEYRLGSDLEYRVLARFDSWTPKELNSVNEKEQKTTTLGMAWEQNKNVQWVASVISSDNQDSTTDTTDYMVTAEVKF